MINRRLHFCGTFLVIISLAVIVVLKAWIWLWILPVAGYGFAWCGHFLFEKNKPATFRHPFKSLLCDFVMFFVILSGRMDLELEKARRHPQRGS